MMHFSNPLAPLMLSVQHIKYGKGCKFFGLPVTTKANGEKLRLVIG